MPDLFNANIPWMSTNIFLALIPVFLGWFVYSLRNKALKTILFFAWLFFVPNTIYVFTDFIHFIKDITKVGFISAILVILQYLILFLTGFITFILSLYPIEKTLTKTPSRHLKRIKNKRTNYVTEIIIAINFLIGFGVVLGRINRFNSWDIILQTENVIYGLIQITSSPKMITLAILFGLFANFIYFLFKKQTVKFIFKKPQVH